MKGYAARQDRKLDPATIGIAMTYVYIAATLRGHKTLRTTERYYNQSRLLDASRLYHASIQQIRNAPGSPASCRITESLACGNKFFVD
jgi:hypothetical protein